MCCGVYFAPATRHLRYGANLPFGIYIAPATRHLRYGANLPFGNYIAPATRPLRHPLISVVETPYAGFLNHFANNS
jgi:hypothetical protein